MAKAKVTQINKDEFKVEILDINLGRLEKSVIREIIQILDNGIYQ